MRSISKYISERVQPGDVFGFSECGLTGFWINVATYGIPFWDLSHVAVVVDLPPMALCESTVLCGTPCMIAGTPIDGVQFQAIRHRIKSYRGKVWHYPLYEPLTAIQQDRLVNYCLVNSGKRYDAIGAFRAAGELFAWIESRLWHENLSSIFCSEFVAATLRYIGRFDTDNASRWNPNRLCRTLVRRGVLRRPRRLK